MKSTAANVQTEQAGLDHNLRWRQQGGWLVPNAQSARERTADAVFDHGLGARINAQRHYRVFDLYLSLRSPQRAQAELERELEREDEHDKGDGKEATHLFADWMTCK